MADLHALIRRMADELDHYRQLLCDDRTERHPLATEARAALAAEPQGDGPTDDEVDAWADDNDFVQGHGDHPCGFWVKDDDLGKIVRLALARWGHPTPPPADVEEPVAWCRPDDFEDAAIKRQSFSGWRQQHSDCTMPLFAASQPAPPPAEELLRAYQAGRRDAEADAQQAAEAAQELPADGEVGELVSVLELEADAESPATVLQWATHDQLRRTADLLARLALQPVPVSERLPGPGDCDAEGRCWWWYPPVPEQTYGYWAHEDDAVPERAIDEQPSHWLPAHALPLPDNDPRLIRWNKERQIRLLLTAEADRAERGDHTTSENV